MKKTLNLFGILFFLIAGLSACQEVEDNKININKGWQFKLVDEADGTEADYFKTDFKDDDWEQVSLPHTAHLEPLVVNDQWQGTCWYRKSIEVPQYEHRKSILIELEAAMNHSKMWVNGDLVTVHQGGYLPVVVDITKYIKQGEKNTIAIRLNNTDNPVTGPKPLNRLDFNMYGGLYRNAWLHIKNKVHISHPVLAEVEAGGGVFITTPKVSEEHSIVKTKVHIANHSAKQKQVELKQTILYNGKVVLEHLSKPIEINAKAAQELEEEFQLKNAKLWSPDDPNLYTMETRVLFNGKEIDQQSTRFGIREFVFKGNDLYINGKKTYLRGVNRHQEYPFIGYALSDNAQYRDAKKIKEAGFDYVRLSHYPHSPAFMDACDELGLVVIDAILGWQFYRDSDDFREYCYRSARELILRDRNHPCVLAWEVSLNETKMPIPFMQQLHDIVHAEYPSKTTYSCGWMNDVYDIYLQARQHRIMHHFDSIQPKPYMVSEYGDWEYHSKNPGLNQHKFNDIMRAEKSSRQLRSYGEKRLLQQALNMQESHNDNRNTPAYSDGYWVMYDYNRGYHDNIESSGVMDIFRLPKFGYYFYKSQRSPEVENVLQIASYWNEKSSTDVKVYANCEEVELTLNDQLIARQKPDSDSITANLLHPPFTFKMGAFKAGQLKAVGYINGKEVSQTVIKTPQKPVALKLWLDESNKKAQAGVNDVLFVYIAAVDANGTINPDFSDEVKLDITGDIKIMNQGDIEAEAGIATALIRVEETSANVAVQATSNNLEGHMKFKVHP